MSERPTLSELRGRVFKHSAIPDSQFLVPGSQSRFRNQEVGNWLARRVGRPSAVYGTWLAVRLGVSAHQVTLAALVVGGASAVAIASGSRFGFVVGAVLAHLAFWLDHVDGQVARWRGSASLDGVYFDYLMHHAFALTQGFALGYGLAARTGELRWAAAGFAVALGWSFLGLQNDCRYKSFFQRLKRERRCFRVEGGVGGRPAPPPPWPRRGRGVLTWPAAKACEPHVVLVGLTVLACLAVAARGPWLACWKGGVAVMAVLAPSLAVGRAALAVSRGAAETEFARWFQPRDDP